MIAVMTGLTGVLGLAIGSFLNVVIFRVPNRQSVVSPASACPGCEKPIRRRDNIPVLSWLLLGARCRTCRMRISARYPAIESGTALAFVGVALLWLPRVLGAPTGMHAAAAAIELATLLYLVAISVALAMIDLDVHRLPDPIVGPAYLVSAAGFTAAALVDGRPDRLLVAGIGMVASLAFYFALAFAYPGGMGLGDVKLAGVIGLALGYFGVPQLVVGTLVAFVLGGLVGLALIIARRAGRKSGIPFGPWMIAGLWTGVFAGGPIAGVYLSLSGLS